MNMNMNMKTLSQPLLLHISSTKFPNSEPPRMASSAHVGQNKHQPKDFLTLALHKSAPLAISVSLLLSASPARAGFLSGMTGIESVPGPKLPTIDFLSKFNEENQKKYAEDDARFKSSPILKELLEKSKLNQEKNKQSIQDKYCLRGAEWGVGDCSAEGMSPVDRDKFIAMLKQKVGVE